MGPRAIGLVLALLACGCAARQAAEVEERMTGTEWRLVRGCLGEPHERDFDPALGDRELWMYRFPAFEFVSTQIDLRGTGGQQAAGVSMGVTGTRDPRPGYCEYEFTLEDGIVVGMEANGRDASGMNADSRCMRKLRRCVPEREELR